MDTLAEDDGESVGKAGQEQGSPPQKSSPTGAKVDLEPGAGGHEDATAAAAAAAPAPRDRQPVALRVELATKGLAQIMQFALWGLMLLLFLLSIVLVTQRGEIQGDGSRPRSAGYHKVLLGLACASLTALLLVAVLYVSRTQQTFRSKMEWSRRHKSLAVDAAVVQGLSIVQCVFWVAPLAAVVAPSCTWPTAQVAAYNMVRNIFFITLMFWMLAMMHSMCRRVPAPKKPKRSRREAPKPQGASPRKGHETSCSVSDGSSGMRTAAAASGASGALQGAKGREEGSGARQGGFSLSADQPVRAESVGMDVSGEGGATAANGKPNLGPKPHHGDRQQQQGQQQQQEEEHDKKALGGGSKAHRGQPPSASASFAAAEAEGLLLVIDRPWREQLWIHLPKLFVWVAVVVLTILEGVKQIIFGTRRSVPVSTACEQELGLPPGSTTAQLCGLSTSQRVTGLIQGLLVLGYYVAYLVYQNRALRDHNSLPYAKYRMTNLYIRVQSRHGSVVMASVVLSIIVQRVSSTSGSCWSYLEGQLGSLPVMLAIVILALISGILYLPIGGVGATLLQTWIQEFSWSEAGKPAALARRAAHLRDLAATEQRSSLEQGARFVLRMLLPHVAPLLSLQDMRGALAQAEAELQKEPMLCVETALRMFYWSRLAYACQNDQAYVNAKTGLSLLGLSHSEVLYEPSSETLCVVGWGGPGNPRLVLAFRGTANLQNVLTDIKFFKTAHLPRRRWRGRLVEVHVGFYNAWREGGFNERLLGRLDEIVGGLQVDPSQLDILITGHSLGGALATLAAVEVHRAYPGARMRIYTLGAPRVGNRAFSGEYNEAITDHWSLINYNDPVPRIPKGLYKRNGQRVTLNPMGDLIIRPSYFELAVLLKRGGTVKDHMTGTYALALAAVLKAQFSPAKCLPGGEEGVVQLAASLDVGEALVLRNLDLESLRDPDCLPEPLELDPKKKKKGKRSVFTCCAGREESKLEGSESISSIGTPRAAAAPSGAASADLSAAAAAPSAAAAAAAAPSGAAAAPSTAVAAAVVPSAAAAAPSGAAAAVPSSSVELEEPGSPSGSGSMRGGLAPVAAPAELVANGTRRDGLAMP